MEYKKPEVVRLDSAICAIQSMIKPHGNTDFLDPKNEYPSVSTYEADE
jgi:hypothetical protein